MMPCFCLSWSHKHAITMDVTAAHDRCGAVAHRCNGQNGYEPAHDQAYQMYEITAFASL